MAPLWLQFILFGTIWLIVGLVIGWTLGLGLYGMLYRVLLGLLASWMDHYNQAAAAETKLRNQVVALGGIPDA